MISHYNKISFPLTVDFSNTSDFRQWAESTDVLDVLSLCNPNTQSIKIFGGFLLIKLNHLIGPLLGGCNGSS